MASLNADRVTREEGRGDMTSSLMLSELQKVHDNLRSAMAEMDAVTREPVAERGRLSVARWRLSQASLKRRTLWRRVFQHMLPRVGANETAVLQALQSANLESLRNSSAHVGNWTIGTIEADWSGYCNASRAIRLEMSACMDAEERLIFGLLAEDARSAERW